MTQPQKIPTEKAGIERGSAALEAYTLTTRPARRFALQTPKHILQSCPLHREARNQFWSQGPTIQEKLRECQEQLVTTVHFFLGTPTPKPEVFSLDRRRRRKGGGGRGGGRGRGRGGRGGREGEEEEEDKRKVNNPSSAPSAPFPPPPQPQSLPKPPSASSPPPPTLPTPTVTALQ